MNRRAFVHLDEHGVGELIERADGVIEFRFDDTYLRLDDRPVLGQNFEDDLGKTYRGKRESQLPVFFANMLPEGRLRSVLERRGHIQERDDFGLLILLGRDLPGAATIVPAAAPTELHREHASAGEEESSPLRFSLAGVQMKFSVVYDHEKLTLPAQSGAGNWIVKLHGPQLPGLAQNEFSMMEWARAARFDVPECSLRPLSDLEGIPIDDIDPNSSAFVIRRYDRVAGGRVHQEDFAQVCGLAPAHKYDHLKYETLGVLIQSIIGDDGFDEYIRRVALMIATGNDDAHLKNWSLQYQDRVHPTLSPVYDQVFTGGWPRRQTIVGTSRSRIVRPQLALNLLGTKHFAELDTKVFERLGARVERASQAREIGRGALAELAATWGAIGSELPMLDVQKDLLRSHWTTVPCLREHGQLE